MVPYFKGSSYAGVGASTGSVTINFNSSYFPSESIPEQYDFLILAVESANETVTPPSGWTQFTNGDYYTGSGTPGGVGSTRLSIFYRFCDDTLSGVTIADSGSHQYATVLVFKGVDTTEPLATTGSGSYITHIPTAQTSVSLPDVYVAYNNSLVVNILSNGHNTNGPLFSSQSNPNLTSLTKVFDYNVSLGVGGGLTVLTGVKTTTGWTGSTEGILSVVALQGLASIVLKPTTTFKLAADNKSFNTIKKFNILKYSKSTSRVSKLIEDFSNPPLTSSSGSPVWNSSQATVTLTSGKWKIEPSNSSSYSTSISRSFVLNKYEELSFDYTTVNTGGAVITLTINIITDTGAFYETITLPANSTGTYTYNLNALRNSVQYNFTETSILLNFRLSGSPVGVGSYLLLDNLSVISNQQNILISDPFQLAINNTQTGLYYNKSLNTTTNSTSINTYGASLFNRRSIKSDNISIDIISPTTTNLIKSKKLFSSSLDLGISLNSNTMYKGVGLIANSVNILASLKNNNFIRTYKILSDTKSLAVTFPDTNTVIYVPTLSILSANPPSKVSTDLPPHIQVPTLEINTTPTAGFYYFYTITFSGSPVPSTHVEDSKKLEADACVDLFEIALAENAGTLYLKMNKTVEWQGNIYEGTGIQIEGVASFADDEVSRPKLSIWNPEGIFSSLVDKGTLEGAVVSRIRVLKTDLDNNLPVFRREKWKLTRVVSLKNPSIVCELRDMMDGQNFLTPGRMFIPPEFKTVSL